MQPTQPRIISSSGGYTMGSSVAGAPRVISSAAAAVSAAGPTVYRAAAAAAPQAATVIRSAAASSPMAASSPIVYSSQPGTARSPTMQSATTIPAQVINAGPARVIQSPTTVTSPTASYSTGGYVTSSGVKVIQQGGTVIRQVQSSEVVRTIPVEYKQNVLSGPGLTQGAYEAKHQDDAQLNNLKELRRTSGLREIPVEYGLITMKQAGGEDGKLTREQFLHVYENILLQHQVELPSEAIRQAVFDLFDRDDNGIVDLMELICGISLLCAGSEDEKIHAVFRIFDENEDGFISMDEMYKFLTSVFKVVLTPNVMAVMNSMGVQVDSAEDLASVTALECFKTADLNQDGKLSEPEFKNWFYAPRNDPSFLFSPVRKLLT